MDQKIEEGYYLNNRKQGVWTEYYCNGKVKNQITFRDGRPNGEAKLFYENGNIKEQGTWKANRWVGIYKSFNVDGQLVEQYDCGENGKRDSSNVRTGTQLFKNVQLDLNGDHTIYNKYKQGIKQGIFKDGRLMDGKAFIYNEDRILYKVSITKRNLPTRLNNSLNAREDHCWCCAESAKEFLIFNSLPPSRIKINRDYKGI